MLVTIGERIAHLARRQPDATALIAVAADGQEVAMSWGELDARANHCAHVFLRQSGGHPEVVAIALPNELNHVIATIGAWHLRSMVVPLDPAAPPGELARMRAAIGNHLFVGGETVASSAAACMPEDWGDGRALASPAIGTAVLPASASATGGTTGAPRFVVRRQGWVFDDDCLPSSHDREMGRDFGQTQLVATPLFHGGFGALHRGLALGHTIILMRHFVPRLLAASIPRHRVNTMRLVPTMMKMLLGPSIGMGERDLSSITAIDHGTASCPPAVKREWLGLVGPSQLIETYSSQEQLAFVFIRGDEWLEHPGSVGRPFPGTIAIVGKDDRELPDGREGKIFMRSPKRSHPQYLGSGPRLREWGDGFFDVGDIGLMDENGYLFVHGRTQECINVGGTLVYAAEIEAVLAASPMVADAFVAPHRHLVLGQIPIAFVVPHGSPDPDALDAFCRGSLAPVKVPTRYVFVDRLPRNDAGKLSRRRVSELLEAET